LNEPSNITAPAHQKFSTANPVCTNQLCLLFLIYEQRFFMYSGDNFFLMNDFPDFNGSCFDIAEYNKTFKKKNVIINAISKDVSYAEHWGPLSVNAR
jgi:hypothetical protein